MSYDVIGAENGYKYVYRYADSAVQLEVYEFPAELSETAKALLDAVRADGTLRCWITPFQVIFPTTAASF